MSVLERNSPPASELPISVVRRIGRVPTSFIPTWVTITCLLVAVPVALTLAREPRFVASIIATSGEAQIPPSALATSVRRLLEDPTVSAGTVQDARVVISQADFAERVMTIPTARGVLVEVAGGTPGEASRLAVALAPHLEQAAERGGERIVFENTRLPSSSRFVDRVVDALPGPFPRRPDPLWAGLAGFVLAAVGWAGSSFLDSRRAPEEVREERD